MGKEPRPFGTLYILGYKERGSDVVGWVEREWRQRKYSEGRGIARDSVLEKIGGRIWRGFPMVGKGCLLVHPHDEQKTESNSGIWLTLLSSGNIGALGIVSPF
jgi:hypothetical protein